MSSCSNINLQCLVECEFTPSNLKHPTHNKQVASKAKYKHANSSMPAIQHVCNAYDNFIITPENHVLLFKKLS